MVITAAALLELAGLPAGEAPALTASPQTFAGGDRYRVEIPSTEGPRPLEAVLNEAAERRVPVHRVSQGSGLMLLTDQMARA